jgi:hypothetical protein
VSILGSIYTNNWALYGTKSGPKRGPKRGPNRGPKYPLKTANSQNHAFEGLKFQDLVKMEDI